MPPPHSTRSEQRAASELAILDAAEQRYAEAGPDGASLRSVAQSVGLDHALVARYFGSKQGLVAAVENRLAAELTAELGCVGLTTADGFAELLSWVHAQPVRARLLVRSGLGDLDPSIVPRALDEQCATTSDGERRARLCGYAAASLVLGWLCWDGFLVPGLQLGRVSHRHRLAAVAAAAASVLQLTANPEPALRPRRLRAVDEAPEPPRARSTRDALLDAAVELFAERGPASVSIRDIARHAGVNHGLIHRHFGSKDDLLAEAIEVGSRSLLPGALAPGGFDIDDVVHAMHHGSPSPRTIARVLVDDIPVRSVRRRYPVLRNLLRLVEHLPADARPDLLADPRLASASAASLVVGSAIWGPGLRQAFELTGDDGIESAVADLGRWLLGAPTPPTSPVRTAR